MDRELLEERVIVVGALDQGAAELITAQLLLLERDNAEREITLYINSPGGPAESELAVYDTMSVLQCPVATICAGAAAGGAALLVAAGEQGRRSTLPNSRFVLRAPRSEFPGDSAAPETVVEEAARLRTLVTGLFARHTGREPAEVADALRRGRFLGAREAVDWGVVDRVVERPPRAWRGILQ